MVSVKKNKHTNRISLPLEKVNPLVARHRSILDSSLKNEREQQLISSKLFENRISMSVSEFAVHIGVSIRTAERMLKRGDIHHKRVGRRVLIPMSAIEAWLNRKD